MKKIIYKEIAKKLNITHAAVSHWFSGKNKPSLKIACFFIKEYGLTLKECENLPLYKQSNPERFNLHIKKDERTQG